MKKAYNMVEPYGLVGAYGIQHQALKEDGRPEIVIEGSMDQEKWTVRTNLHLSVGNPYIL